MFAKLKHLVVGFKNKIQNTEGICRLYVRSFQKVKAPKVLVVSIEDFNQGRYGFQLINYFQLAGYHIAFYKSGAFLRKLYGYDQLIFNLAGVSLFRKNMISEKMQTDLLFFRKSKKEEASIKYQRKFELNLDYFNRQNEISRATLVMPFFIHPIMNQYTPVMHTGKRNRILFYGSNDAAYDSDAIKNQFKLLTRSEVYCIIKKSGINYISPDSYESFEESINNPEIKDAFFFLNSSKVWIPAHKWMTVLSSFDFFIATPGTIMPHSHNVIEAMHVGAIPIIQYADWFFPMLIHEQNCIQFNNQSELIRRINQLLTLSKTEISQLRKSVSGYYSKFIEPKSLSTRIEAIPQKNIDLFFNAEELSLKK